MFEVVGVEIIGIVDMSFVFGVAFPDVGKSFILTFETVMGEAV